MWTKFGFFPWAYQKSVTLNEMESTNEKLKQKKNENANLFICFALAHTLQCDLKLYEVYLLFERQFAYTTASLTCTCHFGGDTSTSSANIKHSRNEPFQNAVNNTTGTSEYWTHLMRTQEINSVSQHFYFERECVWIHWGGMKKGPPRDRFKRYTVWVSV